MAFPVRGVGKMVVRETADTPISAAAPVLQYKDAATDKTATVKNVRVADAKLIEAAQSLIDLTHVFGFIGPPSGQRNHDRRIQEQLLAVLAGATEYRENFRTGYAEPVVSTKIRRERAFINARTKPILHFGLEMAIWEHSHSF